MCKKFSIIGGDKRNIFLAEQLEKLGHEVLMYGFEKKSIIPTKSLKETIYFADFIICGIPFSRDNITLNTPFSNDTILIKDFLSLVPENKKIFTGALNKDFKNNDQLVDIFNKKNVTIKSTIATVEGAIKIAIENTEISLHDSNILVIGYGKIGSYLSKILKSLGANVSVISKNPSTIKTAIEDGFKAYSNFDLDRHLSNKNIIFNTAEVIQIDKNNITLINNDCIYVELASKPFGINYEESVDSPVKVIFGLSLPGIVSPKTISEVLLIEILKYIKEMNV